MKGYVNNVLEAIGNTPIVKLDKSLTGVESEIYVKLEYLNPGGSIKDRIGSYILEKAKKNGDLKPGGTIYIDIYSKKWHTYLWLKYILRPITKRIPKEYLFIIVKKLTPFFIPYTKFLKSIFGTVAHRLSPIVEYSDLGLDSKLNNEWSILDTFDMYSPQYDQPKSLSEVKKWFTNLGFKEINIKYGPNGIIGSAKKK